MSYVQEFDVLLYFGRSLYDRNEINNGEVMEVREDGSLPHPANYDFTLLFFFHRNTPLHCSIQLTRMQ